MLGQRQTSGPYPPSSLTGRPRLLPSPHISPQGDALICLENKTGYWGVYSGAPTVVPSVCSAKGYIFCSLLRLLSRGKVRRPTKGQWSSEEWRWRETWRHDLTFRLFLLCGWMTGSHPHPQEAEQYQAQRGGKQEWAGFPESFQRSSSAHHGQGLGAGNLHSIQCVHFAVPNITKDPRAEAKATGQRFRGSRSKLAPKHTGCPSSSHYQWPHATPKLSTYQKSFRATWLVTSSDYPIYQPQHVFFSPPPPPPEFITVSQKTIELLHSSLHFLAPSSPTEVPADTISEGSLRGRGAPLGVTRSHPCGEWWQDRVLTHHQVRVSYAYIMCSFVSISIPSVLLCPSCSSHQLQIESVAVSLPVWASRV